MSSSSKPDLKVDAEVDVAMRATPDGSFQWLAADRPPLKLFVVGVAIAFGMPAAYILLRTAQLGSLGGLDEALAPTGRSVLLAVTVSMSAAVVGIFLGWAVISSDVPSLRALRTVLPLALVLPSFVGAAAYLAAFAPGGVLHTALSAVVELRNVFTGGEPLGPVRLRGFWPSWLFLALFTFPYVLLPVMARARALSGSLHESALLLGRSQRETFFAVTVPQLRPAILSGTLLVFLYTLSEFGAVQLLGYDTLTRIVFASFLADQGVSFLAATILMLLAVTVVLIERSVESSYRPDSRADSGHGAMVGLGRFRWPVAILGWTVVMFSLVVPIASFAVWAGRGLVDGRVNLGRLPPAMLNTAAAGLVTALCTIVVMVPVATLSIRSRSRITAWCTTAVLTGFALPGVVLALSMVFWTLRTPGFSWMYQTLPALIAVYIVHFGAQALGSAENAVRAVPANVRESASLLEPQLLRRFGKVQLPLMRPGLISGAGLVLLSTVKELPATLLLAPIGFDTLATRIWSGYAEGFYAETAVPALVLLAVSGVLTWLFVIRSGFSSRAEGSGQL